MAASSGVNLPLADILQLAYTVMAQTAANFSSMAQDVAKQRQTEIDAMCGFIVAKAQQQGNSAPQNEALLQRVMKMSGELRAIHLNVGVAILVQDQSLQLTHYPSGTI